MVYVEYRAVDGYVVQIHEAKPPIVGDGNALALSSEYSLGDEFEYYIVVNEVQESNDGSGEIVVVSSASVRQSPPAQDILRRIAEANNRVADLEDALAIILGGAI
jgi:hypothetical protein